MHSLSCHCGSLQELAGQQTVARRKILWVGADWLAPSSSSETGQSLAACLLAFNLSGSHTASAKRIYRVRLISFVCVYIREMEKVLWPNSLVSSLFSI